MNRMRAFRWIIASIIIVLGAALAYSWDGSTAITSLAIDPQTPTTLYAGTYRDGWLKSIDGGITWDATPLWNKGLVTGGQEKWKKKKR